MKHLKRVVRNVGAAAGLGATFVAAAAGGLVLHMGLPPARRLVATTVDSLLTGTFRGKLQIVELARLQGNGIDGGVLTLRDPDGRTVAIVRGVRARIALPTLLASLLSSGDLRVRVTDLSIDSIDLLLAQAPDGALSIAEAFQPATLGPPPPPTKSKGLDLSLPRISLGHAWVHGGMSPLAVIDADLDDARASFDMTPDGMSVDLRQVRVVTRAMPKGADLGLLVKAKLAIPSDPDKMTASGTIAGTVGGIDVQMAGTVDGKRVDATLDVPRAAPDQINRLVGSPALFQAATAHVEAHGSLPDLDPSAHVTIGDGAVDVQGSVTLPSEGQSDLLARITVAARDLDVRAASATAPPSKLGLDLWTQARLSADNALDGTYGLKVLPGSVGPNAIPEVRLEGTYDPTLVRGAGHIALPGAPSDVQVAFYPVAKGGRASRSTPTSTGRISRASRSSGAPSKGKRRSASGVRSRSQQSTSRPKYARRSRASAPARSRSNGRRWTRPSAERSTRRARRCRSTGPDCAPRATATLSSTQRRTERRRSSGSRPRSRAGPIPT